VLDRVSALVLKAPHPQPLAPKRGRGGPGGEPAARRPAPYTGSVDIDPSGNRRTARMARFSYSAPPKTETPPAKVTRQTLREAAGLFGSLWPYRLRFAAALAALFLSSLLALALPYLAGSLIDGALAARGEQPISGRWHTDINTTALLLVGVLALQALSSFF